jgi:ubiquinone/menaquinone biosynthesis C-methylase UbiE
LRRPRARWLDVGCGTGVLAHAVLELASPASVVGIDPEPAQIAHASRGPAAGRAAFQVADATSLPFADTSFDIAAAALTLNFIPERSRAMARCGA